MLALATCALVACLAPAAGAAATTAVSSAATSPRSFVPNWDGHTDSTVVQYHLVRRSAVRVRILDPRGRIVATIDAGRRSAGMHQASWDGRNARGRVLPPGRYRVRVDARPLASVATGPGAAAMAGTVVVAGARAATIQLQAPPVALRGVRLGRAALGRSKRVARTVVRFDLSTTASIAAAVVDGNGRAVRTLAARRMRAGANALAWDGRNGAGTALPDGEYALVVAASGDGRPTATTRLPLRVDRTMPTLRTARRVKGSATSSGVTLPIRVVVGERTSIQLRLGRHVARRSVEGGTHTLSVPAEELGIRATRRARLVAVRLVATDDAGNAIARRIVVQVPPVTRIVPRPQPPKPGGDVTPGALSWPVGGIVTSEFGMRGGRPHTGIDIAVPSGTPIHPVAAGTVSYVGVLGGYGNLVMVDHPSGLRTYYAHMSRFGAFGVGDSVAPLDTIGFVGCTGSCTGPHVHFETRVDDVPRDPRSFLTPR